VDGQNWWQWVFCTSEAVFHITRDNRSSDVIQDVLGKHQAEVWVSDCYSAQLKAPAQQRQICLAHQIRDLKGVIDRHPTCFWAQAMQTLFRAAIHLHHQRQELPQEDFHSKVARLERLCDWLVGRAPPQSKAAQLQRRYQKHRDHLLVFLQRTDVSPTNNVSERALRTAVVHRKVLGSFRSEWGVQAYSALASVIDTAELNGQHAFQAIQDLFGPPALPIPSNV
jgi:transposase